MTAVRQLRRWLLWNARCRRGRRCANIVMINGHSAIPGVVVSTTYTCGGCGTRYRSQTLVGRDGALTPLDRETLAGAVS